MHTEEMKTRGFVMQQSSEYGYNARCATLPLYLYRFMLAQRLAESSSRGIHSLQFLLPQPLYFPEPNFKT
jgi:hypothetical protein